MKAIVMKFIYALTVISLLMICSCSDDFTYNNVEIPEGEGDLKATVTFTPTVSANLNSRTAGDAIKSIESLCVLVYTTDGNLVKTYSWVPNASGSDPNTNFVDYECSQDGYEVNKDTDYLDGNESHTDEAKTPQATFTLPGLPYGKYHIYAVANMGDLSTSESTFKDENDKEVIIKDAIQTAKGLRNIRLKWDSDDISSNNQMFGYFTLDDEKSAKGFDAPEIAFTPANSKIHAWINRVASKVTIAFDASGLNQDVTIYIRNVTIYDIPKECVLGNTNTPTDALQLLNHPEIPYSVPDYTKKPEVDPIPNTRFEYNSDGLITDPDIHTGEAKTDGYKLQNHLRQPVPEGAHYPTSPSLFFFENNQGDKSSESDKVKYDKTQQHSGAADGVGTAIREPKNDNDFKDRVPYGTYIEVEAYYISENPGKVGEGTIKYRFMLGKNVTYDYNAQRNYHFKLTLGFNGWANQPDWHIDYEQPQPGIEVQPDFRVSYLYNQKSELPIRILETENDKIESIVVKIVENNWAPYDPETGTVPPSVTDESPNPTYAFKWNLAAYNSAPYMRDGAQVPYYGFLALHLPARSRDSEVVTTNFSLAANQELEDYYNKEHEGDRTFTDFSIKEHGTGDDSYSVIPVLDDKNEQIENQKTLMVPVWTRAKTLIRGSGFSGNNPYEGYERKAKLEITATFRLANGDTYTPPSEEVNVYQVKRLVNPKGVWRASDRNEAFHVTLLEAESGNDMANFIPFDSQGEWTAFIEGQTNANSGFYLTQNSATESYQDQDGTIHGYSGSEIHFDINFDRVVVSADEPHCAIVKVLYHNNQCLHKILVRKGYEQPVRMGGNKWSSYSLYQASYIDGVDGVSDRYNAVLTKNPLMLGSMFRRGRQSQGIFVVNNIAEEGGVGPFEAPGDYPFLVGRKDANNNWRRATWSQIGYRDDADGYTGTAYGREQGNKNYTLGTFYEGNYTYKVPTYADFQALTSDAEFGFGVVYGSSATAPARTAADAYGLIDPYNEGLFDDPRGMRGVIAYKKDTGNQIFFPMGKYGTGRRNNFIMTGANAGVLRYGDVDYLLTSSLGTNLYRPIPYNLMIQSGNVYWIDKYVDTGGGCLGWDMNYFNFDFNPYTANNVRDACPIKFIIVED